MKRLVHRSIFSQSLAVLLVAFLVRGAFGSPRDVLDGTPDVSSTSGGEASDDSNVSSKTGAFTYRVPIEVPPGRLGVQPSLALSYSSQGEIYGGIASGWTLDIPEITRDPATPLISLESIDGSGDVPWVSSLSGGQRLVPLPDGVRYVAQHDGSYTEYRKYDLGRGAFTWRARTTDGTTFAFGLGDHMSGADTRTAHRFPLTAMFDRWGNTVRYRWEKVTWRGEVVDYRLASIEYTSNRAAGLDAHARVVFAWGQPRACAESDGSGGVIDPTLGPWWDTPIGASESWRSGKRELRGASALRAIRTYALDSGGADMRLVGEVSLSYGPNAKSCTRSHAPYRRLVKVQKRAIAPDGTETVLPPLEFSYGHIRPRFDPQTFAWTQPDVSPDVQPAAAWGERFDSRLAWPGLESMMIDLDADGLLDRLTVTDPGLCSYVWQRGTGTGFSSNGRLGKLPEIAGDNGQGCFLNHQVVGLANQQRHCGDPISSYFVYRFLDVVGDDDAPDLVAQLHYDAAAYDLDDDSYQELGLPAPDCAAQTFACPDLDGQLASCTDIPGDWSSSWPPASQLHALYDGAGRTSQDACLSDPDCDLVAYLDEDDGDGESEEDDDDDEGKPAPCWFGDEGWDITCPKEPELPDEPPYVEEPECNDFRLYPHVDGCAGWQSHVWYVWENNGDGSFHVNDGPTVMRSPIPLDSTSEGSVPAAGGAAHDVITEAGHKRVLWTPDPFYTQYTLIDINGDGHIDAVRRGIGVEYDRWYVFLGDGAGRFVGDGDGPIMWEVPGAEWPSRGETIDVEAVDQTGTTRFRRLSSQRSALMDLNGDGMPDLVRSAYVGPDGDRRHQMLVHYNNGRGFHAEPAHLPPEMGARIGGSITIPRGLATEGHFIPRGDRLDFLTNADVDGDGRVDVIGRSEPELGWDCPPDFLECPHLFINTGGNLADRGRIDTGRDYLLVGKAVAEEWSFRVTRRPADYTGDGYVDLISPNSSSMNVYGESNRSFRPPRLMYKVDNGQGGSLVIRYAVSTNSEVVEQDTGDGRALSRPTWVVRSLQERDSWGPTSTTSYRYRNPVHTYDYVGRRGFRGFERVVTTSPSGAVTVDDYDYDLDWRGRLAASRVYEGEAQRSDGQPHQISETTTGVFSLHGGLLTTFHPVASRSWTCNPGDSEAACKASGRHQGTSTAWHRMRPEGAAEEVAWVPLTVRRQAGAFDPADPMVGYTPEPGDHEETTYREMVSDGDRHWIYDVSSYIRDLDAGTFHAHKQNVHSSDKRYAERACSLVDFSRWACAETERDPSTGRAIWTQKPAGARTTYEYDDAWMYRTKVTNALGHEVTARHDYGTGAKLEQLGPNVKVIYRTVRFGGFGGFGGSTIRIPIPVLQAQRIVIDGFGRTLSESASIDHETDGYRVVELARTTYEDADVAAGTPRRTISEQRVDVDGDRWLTTVSEADGRGRVIREKTRTFGDHEDDAITETEFDAAGNVALVRAPDPTGENGFVTYRYHYDSLGRSLGMRRDADGSGFDVSYPDAFTTLRRDYVVERRIGEALARKEMAVDEHGRLREVSEWTGGAWATTHYDYDTVDRLESVVDPDGVTTSIEHDIIGNRIAIDRDGRRWEYEYDLNGNLTAVIRPHPPGATLADYTSSTVYDALDRPISRSPAPMGIDSSLAGLLLSDQPTTWRYDDGTNAIGQLSRVEMPFGTISYAYDARGQRTEQAFALDFGPAGHPQLAVSNRVEERRFNALGLATRLSFASAAPSQSPDLVYDYDARGLPRRVTWANHPSGDGTVVLAAYDRNVAGLVTEQHRDDESGHLRTFEYDGRGRVRVDEIRRNGLKSREEMKYYQTGDLASLESFREGLPERTFHFGYDDRHQLVGASDDQGYEATFSYTEGGRLASAYVDAPVDAPNVRTRDVGYEYLVAHREALAELRQPDGSPLATYTYDAAGNVIERGGAVDHARFVYDGSGRMRMAIQPGGRATVYYYTPGGKRLAALELASENPGASAESLRLWLGQSEILLAGDGTDEDSYAHVHLGDQRVARIRGTSDYSLVYHNGLGHMVLAQSRGQAVLDAFVYTPFGELLARTGAISDGAQPPSGDTYWKRFNGKEYDFESGLYYYGHRYYDPVSMRWNRADPLFRVVPEAAYGEPRRANLYTFSLNNPLRYVDPDGLNGEDREPGGRIVPDGMDGGPMACDPRNASCTEDERDNPDECTAEKTSCEPEEETEEPEPDDREKVKVGSLTHTEVDDRYMKVCAPGLGCSYTRNTMEYLKKRKRERELEMWLEDMDEEQRYGPWQLMKPGCGAPGEPGCAETALSWLEHLTIEEDDGADIAVAKGYILIVSPVAIGPSALGGYLLDDPAVQAVWRHGHRVLRDPINWMLRKVQ